MSKYFLTFSTAGFIPFHTHTERALLHYRTVRCVSARDGHPRHPHWPSGAPFVRHLGISHVGHDGHSLLVELEAWSELLDDLTGGLTVLLDVAHELHEAGVVVGLGFVDSDNPLEVLVLGAVADVLLLGELRLGLGEPLWVLYADLLHGVVHELLAQELPHHAVNYLLVILLLAHLLELAHHLTHNVLPHGLHLRGFHALEVRPRLPEVVQELVDRPVRLGRVLVLDVLELIVQVILDGVDALHGAAETLEGLLKGVTVHGVLEVGDQLVHGVGGVLLVLVLHGLIDPLPLRRLGLVAHVHLLLLFLFLLHSVSPCGVLQVVVLELVEGSVKDVVQVLLDALGFI
mmetsp:Transcript_20544/g.38309  ORF Transcript_20544/g.38309 Transcript_20544/m.38309 type:complete len:345 (+) Transcript_20544:19-1053(+)